jgi:hypothetical protein
MDRRLSESQQAGSATGVDRLRVSQLRVTDSGGGQREAFQTGDDLLVTLSYQSVGKLDRPYFCIWVSDARSMIPVVAANMLVDDFVVPTIDGPGELSCRFKAVPLMPRAYNVWVEVYGKDRAQILYKARVLGGFRVAECAAHTNGTDPAAGRVRFTRAHGLVSVPYEWRLSE